MLLSTITAINSLLLQEQDNVGTIYTTIEDALRS